MKNICRTCMAKEVQMIPIFDQAKSPSISDMIMAISSLEWLPNDPLPSKVCVTCFETLEMTYYFKEQIIRYNNVLQKQVQRVELLAPEQVNQQGVGEAYFFVVKKDTFADCDEELPTENLTSNIDDYPLVNHEPLISMDDPLSVCNVKSELTLTSEARADDLCEETSSNAAVNSYFEETEMKTEEIELEEQGVQFGDNSQIIPIVSQNEEDDVSVCSDYIVSVSSPHDATNNSSQDVQHNSNKNGEITSAPATEGSKDSKICLKTDEGKPKRFACTICEKAFKKLYTLSTHMRTHTGDKPYKCQQCNATFTQKGSLNNHMRVHADECRLKSHKCEICGNAFTTFYNLKVHVKIHSEEKPFKCQHCNLTFRTSSNLNRHSFLHTAEGRPRRHKCEVCKNNYESPSQLKIHLRGHTGERPFKCQHCDMSFPSAGNLKIHTRKHTGETPFKCQHCDARFTQSSNMKLHVRTKHSADAGKVV